VTNDDHAPDAPQTPSITISGDYTTTGGVVILPLQDWVCPVCQRVFHKSLVGPNCPICKVPMERQVEKKPFAPGRSD
jgi:rubrerythrin